MTWGFLSEFWNSITGVGDYTIEFFKNIGLAVAGAVGNLFENLLHNLSDFFVFLSWIFQALKLLFLSLTLPISYVFNFLKGFIISASKTPITPEANFTFSTSTMSIFESLPYWNTMSSVLGIGIIVIATGGILWLVLKI